MKIIVFGILLILSGYCISFPQDLMHVPNNPVKINAFTANKFLLNNVFQLGREIFLEYKSLFNANYHQPENLLLKRFPDSPPRIIKYNKN